MRVTGSDISMSMKHDLVKTETTIERMNLWTIGSGSATENGNLPAGLPPGMAEDIVELSRGGINRWLRNAPGIQSPSCTETEDIVIDEEDRCKILLLEKFMETLTGKKFRFYVLKDLKLHKNRTEIGTAANPNISPLGTHGWGFEYDFEETKYERENLTFASRGVIKTGDGKTINFDMELKMSREFASKTNISIRAGDAVNMADPLIINLNGNSPKLSSTTFLFDLDLDGNKDEIYFAGQGSGFLALDLNGDGVINNGGELFGPSTGNGFLELAKYDSDNNDWIDENDPIFGKLKIWTRDGDGNDKLLALGVQGIGAIYLGNIETPFQLKTSANQLQGQLARSGIFLAESGKAGTIHHIDLAL